MSINKKYDHIIENKNRPFKDIYSCNEDLKFSYSLPIDMKIVITINPTIE